MGVVYSFDFSIPAASTAMKEIKIVRGFIEPIALESGSAERKIRCKIECDGNQILPSLAGGDASLWVSPPDQVTLYSVKYCNRRDLATLEVIAENTSATDAFVLKVVVTVERG